MFSLLYYTLYCLFLDKATAMRPPWLKDCFLQFDHDNNGALTMKEIKSFMKHISVKVDDKTFCTTFEVRASLDTILDGISRRNFPTIL